MTKLIHAVLISTVLGVSLASFVLGEAVAGPYEDGVAAYQRGDYPTALTTFRRLAKKGNANAQCNVGLMYAKGRGVAQDYVEAMKWYRLAAAQGKADALLNLGAMYDNGQGVAQDYAEAAKWYRLAAEHSNVDAFFNLGIMYMRGQGFAQDDVHAHMWFELAEAQGHPDAVNNLALFVSGMTPAQIEQAKAMATKCKASKFKDCD